MNARSRRSLLGTSSDLATRLRVFLTDEAVEVDVIDHFEVTRKRVFFDDVLLVTLHRQRAWGVLVVLGLFLLFWLPLTVGLFLSGGQDGLTGGLIMSLMGLPLLLAFVLQASLGQDIVTVYGSRTSARMRFSWSKAKARAAYDQLCARARRAQRGADTAATTAG